MLIFKENLVVLLNYLKTFFVPSMLAVQCGTVLVSSFFLYKFTSSFQMVDFSLELKFVGW